MVITYHVFRAISCDFNRALDGCIQQFLCVVPMTEDHQYHEVRTIPLDKFLCAFNALTCTCCWYVESEFPSGTTGWNMTREQEQLAGNCSGPWNSQKQAQETTQTLFGFTWDFTYCLCYVGYFWDDTREKRFISAHDRQRWRRLASSCGKVLMMALICVITFRDPFCFILPP